MSPLAVVIGAGVDELVAAHYLRRAGHRVRVLDHQSAIDDDASDSGWIPPQIVRDLALDRHGLTTDRRDPWAVVAMPDGSRLELWHDMWRSVEAIRKTSPRDAGKWPAFCERMNRLALLLETLYAAPPPDPMSHAFGDLAQLAGLSLRARRLGREGLQDLLRLMPMSVADWLDEWFESDVLKGVLGGAAVMNLCQGPRSGGTAFNMLHHHVGSPVGVFRPPSSNMARVLRELPDVETRRGARVARILVREGRVTGVALESGEEIGSMVVVSGADPRRTLLELIDVGWLDPQLARAVRNIRSRGVVARVTLMLDRPFNLRRLVVAPSLDYLERAYDDAKYGRVSRAPYLEARSDGQSADGRHRVEVHVQYAPYTLAQGEWDDARKAALGDLVADLLSQHAPEMAGAIVERSVLSPRDLEDVRGYPEGQAYHAELGLDQVLWMRPVPQLARYRTPIAGLYLCGPAMHPGGGVAGAAGANAAKIILSEVRKMQ